MWVKSSQMRSKFKFPRARYVMRMKVSAEMDVVKEILGRMSKLPIKQKRLEDETLRNLAIDAYRCCRKVLTVPSDFGAYCEEEI